MSPKYSLSLVFWGGLGAGVAALVAARHMLARRPAVMGDKEIQRNEGHCGTVRQLGNQLASNW
jgi:hypothetical protein